MPTRSIGWLAAILAMLITLTLVVGELIDAGQRRWWAAHPLTTDTVGGLLVLLVTILAVNQLLNRRQARQRGHAIAAQAAIMVAQATRSVKAVSSVIDGSGDRSAASDGFRTYMLMLLICAPVLIDDPVARRFLEQAQYLGGVMAGTLSGINRSTDGAAVPSDGTGDAWFRVTGWTTPCNSCRMPRHRLSRCSIPRSAIPSSSSAGPLKSRGPAPVIDAQAHLPPKRPRNHA